MNAFWFNIRNYSREVINIQRPKEELNIIFPRVNEFGIKQKEEWNICFITYHQYQTRSGKIKITKLSKFWSKHKFFLRKTPSKSFYIICVGFFSEIINP